MPVLLSSLLRKRPLTPTAQVLSTVCLIHPSTWVAQYQTMGATGAVLWPTAALSPQQSA